MLTKQYEMARLSESKDLSPFQVLQKAKVPERKSQPVRSKVVLLSIFYSLFLSGCLAFVLEKFSRMPDSDRVRWKGLMAFLPYWGKWRG